ncbi:MAG: hypothetical protein SGJ02_03860 [bacterium]|nr:hypothetical protein [bacterium]
MKKILLLSIISCGLFFNSASASDATCLDLVKSCFSETEAVKSNCFYRATSDKSCENTDAGKLIHKRWTLSGTSNDQGAYGFLGPVAADESCTNGCDNQWLAFMIAKESTDSIIKHVDACLEACKEGNPLKILRP